MREYFGNKMVCMESLKHRRFYKLEIGIEFFHAPRVPVTKIVIVRRLKKKPERSAQEDTANASMFYAKATDNMATRNLKHDVWCTYRAFILDDCRPMYVQVESL